MVTIAAVVTIAGMALKPNTTEVNNVEVKVPTADEQLEAAVQKMIEEAVMASSTDITTAKEKAAQEVEDKMKKDIEASVRATIRTKVDPDWREVPKNKAPIVRRVPKSEQEKVIFSYFSDIPVMIEVSRCESGWTHYKEDGSVLRGRVDARDSGAMQVNKGYHEKAAQNMGLNIDVLEDNLAYARHLYNEQGLQPWKASKPCWGQLAQS